MNMSAPTVFVSKVSDRGRGAAFDRRKHLVEREDSTVKISERRLVVVIVEIVLQDLQTQRDKIS